MGSVISVPMTAAGSLVGAIVFVNEVGSRAFDSHDLEIAEEVGRRAAIAIENARISDERARVADALQRELLPPSLPRMPGWEVATMYEPAGEINEVGGDFYEVFPVEGGWAVVLGDVSGKGAAAAAVTAEARHTIRTAGTVAADPVAGLHVLDAALRGRDDVALCSVAMVVLPEAADVGSVLVYLAGHPHPIALRNGRPEPVGDPGPLLGVVDNPTWNATAVRVEPGDQLILYTDGVIEARGARGERFGSDRLREGLVGVEVARARGRPRPHGAVALRRRRPRRRRGPGRDPPRRARRCDSRPGRGRGAGARLALMDHGPAADDRRPALFLVAGAATAIVSIALAAVAGPPYLALASLSPWLSRSRSGSSAPCSRPRSRSSAVSAACSRPTPAGSGPCSGGVRSSSGWSRSRSCSGSRPASTPTRWAARSPW